MFAKRKRNTKWTIKKQLVARWIISLFQLGIFMFLHYLPYSLPIFMSFSLYLLVIFANYISIRGQTFTLFSPRLWWNNGRSTSASMNFIEYPFFAPPPTRLSTRIILEKRSAFPLHLFETTRSSLPSLSLLFPFCLSFFRRLPSL